MNMISATKMEMSWGPTRAIDGVDIDIPQGSFVAVLGHKRFRQVYAGEAYERDPCADRRNHVGGRTGHERPGRALECTSDRWYGLSESGQSDHRYCGGRGCGIRTGKSRSAHGRDLEAGEESLRSVGMIEYRKASPNKLSGGQKQRVAIAGVIAMEPKCIVLDEPTAMLDPNGRKEVIRAVEKLRKEKKVTVILITHYMEEVIDADQVFVMDGGHIVMHGTPREIFSRVEELKSYRMDVPQVTMLAEELRNRGLDIPRGILRREELVEALCRLR